MNQQPVIYYQTDPRWKNIPYAVKGEHSTIGGSGCGPTAVAMVLATWADKSVTPKTECAWALAHGWKCLNSGTYYGYVVAATKRYGLKCTQLNGASIYGNSTSTYHAQAKAAIEAGDLVIACMGRGTWTSSGHFVTVWDIRGNTIYINDPASSRLARTQGDYSTFKKQVKYYWVIKNPGKTTVTTKTVNYIVKITDKTGLNCRNGAGTGYSIIKTYPYDTGVSITKETSTGWGYTGEGWINLTNTEKVPVNTEPVVKEDELDMTKEAFIASLSNAEAYELLSKALNHMSTLAEPTWSKSEGGFQAAVDKGVINGGAPERLVRRDEMTAVLKRLGLL